MNALPTWVNALIVLAAAILLATAAKVVVDSAVALARRLGVSELVMGLTVVALGTSAPEFGVTLVAAFEGRNEISLGNIVGSNIFNLGFILGGAVLLRAIPSGRLLVWRDGVMLVASSFLLFFLIGSDLVLGRLDGVILLGTLVFYLWVVWLQRKRQGPRHVRRPSFPGGRSQAYRELARLLLGLASIGMASHLLIAAAAAIARDFGVSEWVIAVTIIAAGTSLPEVVTTLAGILRGHYSVGIGNILGSDIFNLLGVLGVAGILSDIELQATARGSLLALLGMTVLTLIFLRTGWKLTRKEGLVLILVGALRWSLDFLPGLFG